MSPGVGEEIGKVANGAIDALRAHPVLLALIVLNAVFLAVIYFSVRDTRALDAEQFGHLRDLLETCLGSK